MFGKLVKYEAKSIGKWYFGLYGITLLISVILSTGFAKSSAKVTDYGEFQLLLSMIFIGLIVGVGLATLILIVSRFNKSLFGREGYLTMTLPVTTHQILLSKLVVSLLISLFNVLLVGFSLVIISYGYYDGTNFWLDVLNALTMNFKANYLDLLHLLSYLLVTILSFNLTVYLSIAIGQLFRDKRGLMGFVAFFTISILLSFIGTHIPNTGYDNLTLLIIKESIIALAAYFGTYYILKNKLNLQ